MTLADAIREHSVRCVYCLRPVWTLSPVCRSSRCQLLEDKYRVRRSSSSPDERERGDVAPTRRVASRPGPLLAHDDATGATISEGEAGCSASSLSASPSAFPRSLP